MMNTSEVAALPGGRAIIKITTNNSVVIVNEEGNIVKDLYTGDEISGLLVKGTELFVLNGTGTIVQVRLVDGLVLQVYETGLSLLKNYGSYYNDLCSLVADTVTFVAGPTNAIYSYNISSQTQKLHVDNLNFPFSVTHGCLNGSVVHIVAENLPPQIKIYDATWFLVRSFGSMGSDDGQLNGPTAAVMSDEGSIFVADYWNSRVSVFTSDGQFVEHIISHAAPYYPVSLSLRDSYLWVASADGRLIRYIL